MGEKTKEAADGTFDKEMNMGLNHDPKRPSQGEPCQFELRGWRWKTDSCWTSSIPQDRTIKVLRHKLALFIKKRGD